MFRVLFEIVILPMMISTVPDTAEAPTDSTTWVPPGVVQEKILTIAQSVDVLVEQGRSEHPILFKTATVLVGLLFMFYGGRFWFVFIFLIGVACSSVILNTGIFIEHPHPMVYAAAGLLVGSLLVVVYRMVILVAGALIGVIASYVVLPEPNWMMVGGSAVVLGFAFSYISKWVIMFITAFFGAKLLVIGLKVPSAALWLVIFTIIGTVGQAFLKEKKKQ